MKKTYFISALLLYGLLGTSCKKYLDILPDKKLAVIHTLGDLNSLLSNYNYINYSDPGIGEAVSDNNFLTDISWESLDEYERAMCTWQGENIIRPYSYYGTGNCWSDCYNIIYIANVVLDNIDKIEKTKQNQKSWNNIKGQAYFLRAKSLLSLSSIFCLAYDSSSADSDLGLPLRLSPDFNEKSIRTSLRETFNQIESDFRSSIELLPDEPSHVMFPGKAAAYGFLARLYIYMRKYNLADIYADSSLQIHAELLDYNSDIQISDNYPFAKFNKEVIYSSKMGYPPSLQYGRVDSNLYNSYHNNDIRKVAFFRDMGDGLYRFRGSYENTLGPFTGMAVNELFIIRAECYIRMGKIDQGLAMLNKLLTARWQTGSFIPYSAASFEEALAVVLLERRKELAFRELRWMDLKRLNKEGQNIKITRKIGSTLFELQPNSLLYAMAIPEDIINRAQIQQNPR